MKYRVWWFGVLVVLLTLMFSCMVMADEKSPPTVSGQWFLSYYNGKSNGKPESRFVINRGYINLRKKLTDSVSGRITPDISVDREGDGEGDLEMRLKYCYADFAFGDIGFFTKSHVEFGLVHRPWTDFEQNINLYRLQGAMFLQRNDVFSSADFGLTVFSYFGGEMDDEYKKSVNSKFAGKYGSLAVGVYNGGGYHAIEQNNNKTVEARITVRPVPAVIPGLQLSYLGIVGKGNTNKSPDWTVNTLFVSLEHRLYVLTGTYYTGTGNFKGKALDSKGDELEQSGYSLFGELKVPQYKISLIGRFDLFDDTPDSTDNDLKRIIAGIAYRIQGATKVLLDYEISTRDSWSDNEEGVVQLSVEYNF